MSEREIALHFKGLTDALRHADPAMTDRVRDALDRRAYFRRDVDFIANSFSVEATVHENERTIVTRLLHRDLGTAHIMKTVQPARRNDGASAALLLREARMTMRVQNAHIVPIETVLRLEDGRPALIMPDCGVSLDSAVRSLEITPDFIQRFGKAMKLCLEAIHAAGIVHCDIAPANLLLRKGNPESLRLCDFGIALEIGERHSDHHLAKPGRTPYASPEQIRGEALDETADLYAAERVMVWLIGLRQTSIKAAPSKA